MIVPPTLVITHPDCLRHDPGPGHAEQIARLKVVLARLQKPEFSALVFEQAPLATRQALELCHAPEMIEQLFAAFASGDRFALDSDTYGDAGTGAAVLRASGAVIAAVDAMMNDRARRVFCAVRPPGHHAEPDHAMGFCFFNNIAVGAYHARAAYGMKRLAIVDFDVHHGNGTEALALRDADLFYASSHQSPLYPGTGAVETVGFGNIVNCPLPAGSGSAAFRSVYEEQILPALDAFAPDLLLISAGFDAHRADPLANLELTEADFAWVTERLIDSAEHHCGGRIISVLEGGYDLAALAESVAAHVQTLVHYSLAPRA